VLGLIRAAIDAVGLTFLMEEQAASYLATGQLVRVLEDWCRALCGLLSLFSEPTSAATALMALIDTLREGNRRK